MRRSLRALVAVPAVAAVAFGSLLAAPVANAADNTITVWVVHQLGDLSQERT